jgi:DNA-binding transcriptional MocR family regulator
MGDYRQVADTLAADIAAGRLRPGDRLLPQRQFARRRGIATSTAARVYAELVRRGLAVGEVGRGTFVRAGQAPAEPLLAEPAATARVDLELNFPMLPDQPALLAPGLAGLLRPDALGTALEPAGAVGTTAARTAAAGLLARVGWAPDPSQVLCAGGGRQALAAVIAALVPAGERLGVESLTYPVVKAIANRLGVRLVPLEMDEAGVVPEAVSAAHRAGRLRAVYLQPTLHNPLGITMPAQRRTDMAGLLAELDLPAVEDTVNGFLSAGGSDIAPLAAAAPDHTVLVDSLSKRVAPGLTLGFAVSPATLVAPITSALRSGGWSASRFALDAATRWIADGTVEAIQHAKRDDARARQDLAAERLAGFAVHADRRAYHLWWELPEPWRAETFVAAAARRGIAVSPGAAFAVPGGRAPQAVRLALASPAMDVLAEALDVLAALARRSPEDASIE